MYFGVFGHSLAAGTFGDEEAPHAIPGLKDATFTSFAKIGSSINYAYDKFLKADLSKFDGIIIFTGINDCPGAVYGKNGKFAKLERLVDAAAATGKPVFLFNVPELARLGSEKRDHDWVAAMNDKITKSYGEGKVSNVRVIDVYNNKDVLKQTGNGRKLHPDSYQPIRDFFAHEYLEFKKSILAKAVTGQPSAGF